jgi:hypothetical protein
VKHLQSCKKGSIEYSLSPSHGSTISKHDFVRAIRKEYGIKDPTVEKHLAHFHDSFQREYPNCYAMICTLKIVVYADLLVDETEKVLKNLCDVCSDAKGRIHIDEMNMILNLGSDDYDSELFKAKTKTVLQNVLSSHFGLCEVRVVDKNVFKKVLHLHPLYVSQFRANVWYKLPDSQRIESLERKQVRKN